MTSFNLFSSRIAGTVGGFFSKTDKIRFLDIENLHAQEDLLRLYSQEPEKVSRIAENMRENGFDKSQPIIVLPDNTIIDGHSRWLAAKEAGLKKVPVIYKDFANTNEALLYAEHLQLDRRNLSDSEKLQHMENLLRLKQLAKSEGKSTDEFSDDKIAKQLNVSPRQVQKMREIENKATIEQLEAIKNNEKTLNEVHNEIKKTQGLSRKPKKVITSAPEATEKQPKTPSHNWDLESFRLGVNVVLSIFSQKIEREKFKTEFSLIEKLSAINSMNEILDMAKKQGILAE